MPEFVGRKAGGIVIESPLMLHRLGHLIGDVQNRSHPAEPAVKREHSLRHESGVSGCQPAAARQFVAKDRVRRPIAIRLRDDERGQIKQLSTHEQIV